MAIRSPYNRASQECFPCNPAQCDKNVRGTRCGPLSERRNETRVGTRQIQHQRRKLSTEAARRSAESPKRLAARGFARPRNRRRWQVRHFNVAGRAVIQRTKRGPRAAAELYTTRRPARSVRPPTRWRRGKGRCVARRPAHQTPVT